jgi:hypothetical protein
MIETVPHGHCVPIFRISHHPYSWLLLLCILADAHKNSVLNVGGLILFCRLRLVLLPAPLRLFVLRARLIILRLGPTLLRTRIVAVLMLRATVSPIGRISVPRLFRP